MTPAQRAEYTARRHFQAALGKRYLSSRERAWLESMCGVRTKKRGRG